MIAVTARENLPTKEKATIDGHVGRLSELLGYGVEKRMLTYNPATNSSGGVKKAGMERDSDQRDAFTDTELATIFSAKWFQTGTGEIRSKGSTHWRPFNFWAPIIGLYAGGRVSELAQLYLDDIRQSGNGIWYIDFNLVQPDKVRDDDAIEGEATYEEIGIKSLKNANAVRVVPIHDELLRLGLVDYAQGLRSAGYQRLFPELKRDPVKGYGKPVGKWFNEHYLGKKLGMKRDGRKVFHSLRHNFISRLDELDVIESKIAQLVGHERGDTQSAKRYRKDLAAEKIKPLMDQLQYPALPTIAPFDIPSGLRAIKWALRLKESMQR